MNAEEFQIPRKITNQLLHYAQISPDQEVCGLIGSKKGLPVSCYPIKNRSRHPENRFFMDEKQQIAAMSQMRDREEEFFAIYHSHPTAPALPSKSDLDMAEYPETLYLIISLDTKGVLELRGFRIDNKASREVALSLVSE